MSEELKRCPKHGLLLVANQTICLQCGAEGAYGSPMGNTGFPIPPPELCTVCGLPIAVGQWPCVSRIVEHGTSVQTDPFSTYFDIGLGEEVTSLGDRWQAMKEQRDAQTGDVTRERLEYRDKMSKGDQSARLDRVREQEKQEQRAR